MQVKSILSAMKGCVSVFPLTRLKCENCKITKDEFLTLFKYICKLYFTSNLTMQCSKLSIYFVHIPGAEGLKIMHPATFPCVQAYIMYRNTLN